MLHEMKPWQIIVSIIVIFIIFYIALSIPVDQLPTRCMDAWCLNK